MAHQVPWNMAILDEFVRIGGLTDREEHIIRLRVAGKSIEEQATILNVSRSVINQETKRLKIKYDNCQRFSNILPKRNIAGGVYDSYGKEIMS